MQVCGVVDVYSVLLLLLCSVLSCFCSAQYVTVRHENYGLGGSAVPPTKPANHGARRASRVAGVANQHARNREPGPDRWS